MIEAQTYEQLGRVLRNARLEMKAELPYIARLLHIRQRYLQALEDGALEQLPGNAYVKGYLQHYARFLSLDEDDIVTAYESIGMLPQRRFIHIPESIRKKQQPGTQLTLATLGVAIILALAWGQAKSYRRAHVPLVAPPPLTAKVMSTIRHQECLQPEVIWPPCYFEREVIFEGFVPKKPVKTIMELYAR